MLKILTLIGARPQIIKSAAVNRIIQEKFSSQIEEIIVHTGQHYDKNMSEIFFNELNISKPKYNLGVGSESHGKQTALMIEKTEEILKKEKPQCLIVYGDTNSTVAGAVAASKLKIPIAHIEAGLRSFDKTMPEEINRVLCDHVSTFLFSPTKTGINNLYAEGFKKNMPPYNIDNPCIYLSGDVMYDNSIYFFHKADLKSTILKEYNLTPKDYLLATIHRESNTDEMSRLANILNALIQIIYETNLPVIFPAHPRTIKNINKLNAELLNSIKSVKKLKIIEPVSFFDILVLEKNAKIVITDSGGIQKEAYFYEVPSIILRNKTEWLEITENNAGKLTDTNIDKILKAVNYYINNDRVSFKPLFGDGNAAENICNKLLDSLN